MNLGKSDLDAIRVRMTGFAIIPLLLLACGQSGKQAQLHDPGKELTKCAALFNIVGTQLPNQLAIDQEALEMRDFFADHARLRLVADIESQVSDTEINDDISDALEELERRHRTRSVPDALLAECYAWQGAILRARERAGISDLRTVSHHTLRELFLSIDTPSSTEVGAIRAEMPPHLEVAVREAFELWAQRGYMTPRKAAATLGRSDR